MRTEILFYQGNKFINRKIFYQLINHFFNNPGPALNCLACL